MFHWVPQKVKKREEDRRMKKRKRRIQNDVILQGNDHPDEAEMASLDFGKEESQLSCLGTQEVGERKGRCQLYSLGKTRGLGTLSYNQLIYIKREKMIY